MTHSGHNTPRQNKPPDPIVTTSLSKSSLNSSTLSISPSASVLLSSSSRPSRNRASNKKSPIMPQQSSSSSLSSSTRNTKLEQIIQNFYTKTAQIIIQSRIPNEKLKGGNSSTGGGRRKINKWFNITTNDCENLKEELKFWKSLVKYHQDEEPPPLVIDIYLETTEPELLQEGDDTRGWHKLDLSVQRILIESWTLTLNHSLPDFPVDLPNLYKRSIVFFRSLNSLVRLLPSHNLYRRLRVHDGEISLGYRLSTNRVNKSDEIPLDHPLSNIDTTQLYEFKEVVTPLGTFKLQLLYREHCQFDTKEDQSPLHGMDIEEYFFTPTVKQHRQEQSTTTTTKKETSSSVPKQAPPPPPTTLFPTTSSSSSSSTRSRLQSYRNTTTSIIPSNRYPTTSTSTTTTSLERRISAPFVSPFKSPSLSSSPQAELMYTSRSQTPERQRPESGSFGRKIEFSSSFEKFKSTSSSNNSSSHNINRITTTSSNITAPDMMRRWSRTSDHSSINLESEEDEEDLEEFMKFIGARQELKLFQQHASIYTETAQQQQQQVVPQQEDDSKKSLSHFRNIQETHNILSDSMSFSIHQKQPLVESTNNNSSYESSSSSKGLNLPAIPSPLHNTESAIHPTTTTPSILTHRRHNSTQESPSFRQPPQPTQDEFFSYPRDQLHHFQLTPQEIVAQSPLKNRQAPPPPPPPSAPIRRISGSPGLVDDDDSLVFKMSELSGGYYDEQQDDYLHRLKKTDSTAMRRINSSGNIPSTKTFMLDDIKSGHYSDNGSSSNPTTTIVKSRHKLTHHLFYNDDDDDS